MSSVYLVRHGQALDEAIDPGRPLSEAGRREVQAVADHLSSLTKVLLPMPIRQVRHSGKARAEQTARIMAAAVAPASEVVQYPGLAPNDDPHVVADELNAARSDEQATMLVGHLPHLARLAGLLLCGDVYVIPVRFAPASVAALRWDGPDGWCLDWFLSPRLIRPQPVK